MKIIATLLTSEMKRGFNNWFIPFTSGGDSVMAKKNKRADDKELKFYPT